MLKKVFSFLMIGAIFSAAVLPIQINAQSLASRTTENKTAVSSDLNQAFAKVTAEDSTLRLDVKTLEKDYLNSTRQKFSGKQRTALYIGIAAAIAVVVIVLVANKDDKKTDNGVAYAGCPGNPLCQ